MTTREDFAARIHWARIVWIAGIINPVMILPQLYQIWATGQTAGVSLGGLWATPLWQSMQV